MYTRLYLEQRDSYLINTPGKNFIKACKYIDFTHGHALDLGCGSGANLHYLQTKYKMYPEGCDKNSDNYEELNTKYELNCINCKIQEYPFKELYDIIVCFNVFMWLSEQEQEDLLYQIRNHLSDRGVFIFSFITNWNAKPRNIISDEKIKNILKIPVVYEKKYSEGTRKFKMFVFKK